MKYVRLTSTPDPTAAPALFGLIADAPFVEETRLLGWNLADSAGVTAVFAVDGDADRFRRALADVEGLLETDVVPRGAGCYLLARIETPSMPLVGSVFEILAGDGLVIVTPVVYRDGAVHVRVIGDQSVVQAAIEGLPAAIDVDVHEIGARTFDLEPSMASLSERQWAAVEAAFALGYYDQPRQATHEDVAAALDCAPSTASEHLQRGEAKLIRSVLVGNVRPASR